MNHTNIKSVKYSKDRTTVNFLFEDGQRMQIKTASEETLKKLILQNKQRAAALNHMLNRPGKDFDQVTCQHRLTRPESKNSDAEICVSCLAVVRPVEVQEVISHGNYGASTKSSGKDINAAFTRAISRSPYYRDNEQIVQEFDDLLHDLTVKGSVVFGWATYKIVGR